MIVRLQLGVEVVECACASPIGEALRHRYHGFVHDEVPSLEPCRVEIAAAPDFDPTYTRPSPLRVSLASPDLLRFEGAGTGTGDLRRGVARLSDVPDIGAVDAMLRALVAMRAPERGAVWLHGAFLRDGGGATVLIGASGAGKTTAARALGGLCDELIVVRVGDVPTVLSTPYWSSTPGEAPLRRLVVLERAGRERPALEPIRGGDALRALAQHWVRYCTRAASERAALAALASLAHHGVSRIRCAEGEAYVPSLRALLSAEVGTGRNGAVAWG